MGRGLSPKLRRRIKISVFSLKTIAKTLKKELKVYRLVLSNKRTPRLAIGYALMPFDIIPDFIPIIGHIDDAVLIPLLVIIALKMIPKEVMEDCRKEVERESRE